MYLSITSQVMDGIFTPWFETCDSIRCDASRYHAIVIFLAWCAGSTYCRLKMPQHTDRQRRRYSLLRGATNEVSDLLPPPPRFIAPADKASPLGWPPSPMLRKLCYQAQSLIQLLSLPRRRSYHDSLIQALMRWHDTLTVLDNDCRGNRM